MSWGHLYRLGRIMGGWLSGCVEPLMVVSYAGPARKINTSVYTNREDVEWRIL